MISEESIRNEEVQGITYSFMDFIRNIPLTRDQHSELENYIDRLARLANTPLPINK